MLKKLLKYDFKSVFKFWWIAAVFSVVLSVLGGVCISVIDSERELSVIVDVSAIIVLITVIVGVVAFSLLSVILVCVRFYKNLFTDEGYLTFTLPVKIRSILNSKIISATLTVLVTYFVVAFDMFTMFLTAALAHPRILFNIDTIKYYMNFVLEVIKELGIYFPVYLVEILLLLVLYIAFSVMFIYACITFASLITKKARVITAIGIYYGSNAIISFVLEMAIIFSLPTVIERLGEIANENMFDFTFALILLCVIVFAFMGCALIYALQYFMLDKKLNLS